MNRDEWLANRLDLGLNEAEVFGIEYVPEGHEARLLVDVQSLLDGGRGDPDPRRVVVMSGVSSVEVWLRRGSSGSEGTVRMDSLEAVAAFFESLSWSGPMYGWAFVDIQDPREEWPDDPSLKLVASPTRAAHTLRWFNECGRDEDGTPVPYLLEGIVFYESIRIDRADGSHLTIDEFAADAKRSWDLLENRAEREAVQLQRQTAATPLSWATTRDMSA